ncbi:MAG: thiolase family protein [Candidatus Eremiobacteraeota bacterium]|nr:thiolase family protein [Candidatus Eremiobacteraeota bacterium]
MSDAVIVDAVRTPSGRRNGMLSAIHPVDLLATVLESLVGRSGIEAQMVDDVIAGCVSQTGEQSFNVARKALLAARFPNHVPGTTIDRQCGSSQQAVAFAAQGVLAGAYECVIACGVESMSRVPLLETAQGRSAELVAQRWSLTREELDRYALESHRRAAAASDSGAFVSQILPVDDHARDEGIRADTSLEKLAALKPAFTGDGVITAGNSSQISDGAAALLVCSAEFAQRHGLRARARIVDSIVVGDDPELMLTAPIPATAKILDRAHLTLDDIDLTEINEAFASVVLAWQRETGADLAKTNVNGGAIALGHPLGATGARLMTILLNELEARDGRYGLQVMCEGGGMANATIIERIT